MLKKIKMALLSFSAFFMLAAPVAVSGVAYAAIDQGEDINKGLCSGAEGNLGGKTDCGTKGTTSLNNTIKTIINVISLIVGAVAVIMIIIGGFRYVASG